MHDRVRDEYPNVEQQLQVQSSLGLQANAIVQVGATQQRIGYVCRSQDGLRIFQATTNGFTFNRLRPYDSWNLFRDEARRLWGIYRAVCKPITVTRVALRYINRLELPSTLKDFKEYLRTVPEVPSELDTGLGGFFVQLQIPQADLDGTLIVSETLAPQTDPTTVPVIVDFDLFRQHDWQSDDEDVWRYLEQLRVRKNVAFEASITDAARKLFD